MKFPDEIFVKNLSELKNCAQRLAARIEMGDWIWLVGDLGAGKTALVREILQAWGVDDPVPSPTYAIMNEYEVWQKKVFHIDAFRLAKDVPSLDAPWDRALLERGIVFVEWPERSGLPMERFSWKIEIFLDETNESSRRLLISRPNS